jgi:anti-repressor protein
MNNEIQERDLKMNELKVFNYDSKDVRIVQKDGEPWWVAKDVCDVFGETNRNRAMQGLADDEKGYTQMNTPGGVQNFAIVNEAGLYSLLFAMQPQKARGVSDEYIAERINQLRAFRRWVTHEVLPAIRKHGVYMTPENIEKVLLNPDTIIKIATQLKEERAAKERLQTEVAEMKPKALFADAVSASDGTILIGELAKILKGNGIDIGQNRLFGWLRKNRYLISRYGSDYNMPSQRGMELGLFRIKETAITPADGHVTVAKTVKVTARGQIYFVNKFLAEKPGA